MRKHTQKHRGGCNCVVFSPSGNYAATGGQDGVIRIWNSDDGSLLTELAPPNARTAASINSVQFSEDKGFVMAASNDKSISVWDFHTGRQRFTMTGDCIYPAVPKGLGHVMPPMGNVQTAQHWLYTVPYTLQSVACRTHQCGPGDMPASNLVQCCSLLRS